MDILPENNAEYGTLEYWDSRYEKEEGVAFDWFKGFKDLKEELSGMIGDKEARILHLGCGNSLLGPELFDYGFKNIVNVDYSKAVIDDMKKRFSELVPMQWIVGDIFEMDKNPQLDGKFRIAIDKGTLDALLTVKHDPWDPPAEVVSQMRLYMIQVAKKLEIGGKFLHITFAQPHFRRRFVEIPQFEVKVHHLESPSGGFEYFCYEAVKIKELD